MLKRSLFIGTSILLATLLGGCQAPAGDEGAADRAAQRPELKVVTSGGFAAAYDILAPRFEGDTGITLVTAYGASSGGAPDSIPSRLGRGEQFDIVILSRASLDNLTEAGLVDAESRTDLVRSSIGMAVREGAALPDISTPEAFVATVLEAESIGYSASASGTYLSTVLFPSLGLWEQLEPKSQRILSERVAAVVARGNVQIGFQQISEILPIEGIQYVGPIPSEYQQVTTFSAGITSNAKNAVAAKRFIDFIVSKDIAPTIARTGLEPVALDH